MRIVSKEGELVTKPGKYETLNAHFVGVGNGLCKTNYTR